MESTVAQRIKSLRMRLGLGQREFAEKLGITQGKLSKIESEDQKPSGDVIAQVLLLFNLHPKWLLNGEGGNEPIFIEDSPLTAKYKELEQKLITTQEELLKYQKKEIEQLKKSGDVPDEK